MPHRAVVGVSCAQCIVLFPCVRTREIRDARGSRGLPFLLPCAFV